MPQLSSNGLITRLANPESADAFNSALMQCLDEHGKGNIDDAVLWEEALNAGVQNISLKYGGLVAPPALAAVLEVMGLKLREQKQFQSALNQLKAVPQSNIATAQAFIKYQMDCVAIQAITDGIDKAMADLVRRLLAAPPQKWSVPNLDQIGVLFIKCHWLNLPLKETRAVIKFSCKSPQLNQVYVMQRLQLIGWLGYQVSAPYSWLDFLFHNLVLPTMDAASQIGSFDVALNLERLSYATYTKSRDNAEHFAHSVGAWLPILRRAGKAYGARLPKLKTTQSTSGSPKVAFFLHSSNILGHTEAFLSFLRGISELDPAPIEPIVYIAGGENRELNEKLDAYGATRVYVESLGPRLNQLTATFTAIRQDSADRGVQAMVFVSVVTSMSFAFAMGVAPVQIWWSMKYHSLSLPEIDGYMALGSFDSYRDIDGRKWRVAHRAMETLFDPTLTTEAKELRRKFGAEEGAFLLGCIGREEKLVSEDYMAALARILKKTPQALFLWTGKEEHPHVLALMQKHGISERCRYVGWINSRLYAQVLDLFVDSFPFASGLTAFEAMAAECPVICMITREAVGTGMPAHLWPVFQGEAGDKSIQEEVKALFADEEKGSLLPFTTTSEAYIDEALRLCKDAAYRKRVGKAMRLFVERYMNDHVKMAETGCQHILEVIEQKR